MAESVIEILIKARDQTRGTLKKLDETVKRIVGASSKKAQRNLANLDKEAVKSGKSLNALSLIKFAALAAGIVSVTRNFLEFNKGIAEVSTLVDSTVISNEELSEAVLELSSTFGSKPTETAAALYQAISAGAEAGAEANQLLEVALKAAIGGVTTAEVAVDTLTTVLNAYSLGTEEAEAVSDALFTAVKGGKTTFDELGASLFQVVPVAAAVGIGFADVTAGLAAITLGGTPTAQAATQLRGAIQGILRPTAELTELFGEFGGAQALLAQENGLQLALELLQDATGGNVGELQKLVGSIEGVNAILALTGDNTDRFTKALEDQANAAGASQEAFEKVNEEISQRFSVALTKLEVGFLRLAAALEPILSLVASLIGAFGEFVGELIDVDAASSFFEDLEPIIGLLKVTFSAIAATVKDFADALFGAEAGGEAFKIVLFALNTVLTGIGAGIAAITDGINVITAVANAATGTILRLSAAVADFFGASDETVQGLEASARKAEQAAFDTFAAFASGDTALSRFIDNLNEVNSGIDGLDSTKIKVLATEEEKAAAAAKKLAEETAKASAELEAQKQFIDDITLSLADLARVTKAEVAISLGLLDQQLDANLISFQEFYAARRELQQEAIDAEIAATAAVRDAAIEERDSGAAASAEARLIILRQQRAQIGVQGARDEAVATAGLADELREVERLLAEREGGTLSLEFQTEEIEAKFSGLLDRLEAEGDVRGQDIVRKLISAEVFEAELDVIEDRFNQTLDNFQARSDLITAQADAGLITQAQAINDLALLRAEALPQLELERDTLQEIADRTGDPAAIERLAIVQTKINELTESTVDLGVAIVGTLVDGFGNAIASIIDGTKSAKEAFRDFARSALAEVAKLILQQIVLNALKSFGVPGFSEGGLVPAFAGGGKVTGAGGPTGDKISAKLSSGEFVMKAKSVRNYGVGFMEAINRSVFPKLEIGNRTLTVPRVKNHFQQGGLVTDSGVSKVDPAAAPPSSLRLINVQSTGEAKEFINSSEGEQVIMNVMRRNSTQVKQYLR